jgi:2-methylcitrate dehydratase PrpD
MSGQTLSISERLAERLARPVEEAARARARRGLLDWAACAVAGSVEEGAEGPRRLAAKEGAGPCRVLRGRRAGPQAAAAANGPAGAVLEMDDVHKRALLHPGPVVIPAALAVAEAADATGGAALLDAVVRGYEAMIRVGAAAGAPHYRFFHATATCGGFGAAAAGASLLGLDRTRTAWALGLAGQQAFGLWQVRHEGGYAKAFHDGRAAANGVAAALLALDGFEAPLRVFEGPQGFFAALAPGADPEAVVVDADAPWAIHEVSFKPHAACRHAHPAIDAALSLRERLDGRTPDRLLVQTYADAVAFCDRPEPRTVTEAKFSLQHSVAVAVALGDAGLRRFMPDAVADPATATLRRIVAVEASPEFTERYPARFGARLVADAGGETLVAEAPDALGDPESPLPVDRLLAKARELCAWGGLGERATDRLIEACLTLGDGADVRDLSAALPGGEGASDRTSSRPARSERIA